MSGIPLQQAETPAAPPQAPATGQPSLVALNMAAFLSMTLPERGFLLSPILPAQGIAIMYAPRGIGKTFAALSVAVAVAAGGEVFNWRAPSAKRVLYVDGEMPATAMQERLAFLVSGMAAPPHALDKPGANSILWGRCVHHVHKVIIGHH